MQEDPTFKDSYDTTLKYESGKSTSTLTGTDSLSWKDKSWVIGVKAGDKKKAYDWNDLKKKRIINDTIGSLPILLVLAADDKSFFAFERPNNTFAFKISNDTILLNNKHFTLNGKGTDTTLSLKPIPAYQEFWHSWKTFNPFTSRNSGE